MKIKDVCKLARQYDREAMTTRQSANFVSGSDVISVRSDVIEPSYEYFVGTVSIVANDNLLFSEDATNVGAYHNEKYTQGMFQRAEDAYAYLEETFKGRKFVQAPYQVDWSKVDRGERHWSNPAYEQLQRDEEAEVQKQRETALLDESVDEQITPTPEVDANYFSTYEIHPKGTTVTADGFPTMEAAEKHICELAANSDQALRKALVMDRWKVIADGTRFEVRQNDAILSTYEYRHSDGLTQISPALEIEPITKEDAAELLDELDTAYVEFWSCDICDDESIVTYRRDKAQEQKGKVLSAFVPDGDPERRGEVTSTIERYLEYLHTSVKNRNAAYDFIAYRDDMQLSPDDESMDDLAIEAEKAAEAAERECHRLRETLLAGLPETRPRLFVDMDGTLARFHDEVQYLERMYEPGFFRDLKPFRSAVETIREFMQQHPDVEVYILSSAIPGYPPGCEQQKQAWLDKYLPEIGRAHRLFPEMGTDKSTVIPGGIRPTDVLLDDYNKNLEEWRQAGGQSVKFVNNINDKALIGERWNGERMYHDAAPVDNAKFLAQMTGAKQTPPSQQRGAHL